MRRFFARYREIRYTIATGDVLLFQGRGLASCLIRRAGRTRWSHAGLADWRDDVPDEWRLECLESRELCGCRAVPLSRLVAQYPGRIDVFRVSPPFGDLADFSPLDAAAAMRRLVGRRYGWLALFGTALLHLPLARWFVRASTEDEAGPAGTRPMFCSQAVAWACRVGGVDLVANLADRLTEPGDLGRSPLLRYLFTLVP